MQIKLKTIEKSSFKLNLKKSSPAWCQIAFHRLIPRFRLTHHTFLAAKKFHFCHRFLNHQSLNQTIRDSCEFGGSYFKSDMKKCCFYNIIRRSLQHFLFFGDNVKFFGNHLWLFGVRALY